MHITAMYNYPFHSVCVCLSCVGVCVCVCHVLVSCVCLYNSTCGKGFELAVNATLTLCTIDATDNLKLNPWQGTILVQI